MIAAIAKSQNAAIATRNIKDLSVVALRLLIRVNNFLLMLLQGQVCVELEVSYIECNEGFWVRITDLGVIKDCNGVDTHYSKQVILKHRSVAFA